MKNPISRVITNDIPMSCIHNAADTDLKPVAIGADGYISNTPREAKQDWLALAGRVCAVTGAGEVPIRAGIRTRKRRRRTMAENIREP